jgi:ABC-2 type transport system ATP-binding protein
MPVVVARGLARAYAGRTVLDGVDLDVDGGEVVGLVGPNGGGKSTLLLLLAGLVRPTAGTVLVDGIPADRLAEQATGAVGLITAEPGLYPLLTGRENLRFFGGLYGRPPDEVDRRSRPLLEELEVSDAVQDQRASTYSSGTRQKVSLARALLLDPKLLLLDEPTSNLDPLSAQIVHRAVRARADQGVAVVLATHDLHAAEHICDRVLAIAGRIVRTVRLEGERRAPPTGALFDLWKGL